MSTSVRFSRMFGRVGARNFSALLLAGVTDSMGSQFVGNLAGTAVAENFRNRGTHHQAAYDDLSKHSCISSDVSIFAKTSRP